MSTFTVTRVRMERCGKSTREHIEGVCTDTNQHYTRKQVVDSINAGNVWKSKAGSSEATIHPTRQCLRCSATPYIETNPDSSKADNLDNLPRC